MGRADHPVGHRRPDGRARCRSGSRSSGASASASACPGLAIVGIAIGFVGVAVLVGPTIIGATGALDPARLLAVIVSPICVVVGSLFASHRASLPRQPLVASGLQMLTGGLVLMVMGARERRVGELRRGRRLDRFARWPSPYLTVIGSLLAFTVFGWLLRVAPLPLVATYAYVNPVVAVILGALVLQEPIDARTVVAGAIIVFAVALIVTARGRDDRRPRRSDRRASTTSASTVRATRRASAITVSIGLTPMPVGKSEVSAT